MKTTDFDYQLPKELIAQSPSEQREACRLMVLERIKEKVEHTVFREIPKYLAPSDCLVINQTRVFPARLIGERAAHEGIVEVLLLRQRTSSSWEALIRPGKYARVGEKLLFGGDGLSCRIVEKLPLGKMGLEFDFDGDFFEVLERLGRTPLPPYIKREPEEEDRERYQTVYAKDRGAVAAPTAGLHFSLDLLENLTQLGVRIVPITLHVGRDSFRPIRLDDPRDHRLESEYYAIEPGSADAINDARKRKCRVIAVGTTTVRCLETASEPGGVLRAQSGWTKEFIYPPYRFKIVDALITNFHLPKSTLLLLVSAFAGREFILQAYQEAIKERYRFYSYGDAMFIC